MPKIQHKQKSANVDKQSVLIFHNGKFWGMANSGGSSDVGLIFTLDSDGTNYTVVHEFNGINGKMNWY